MRLVLDVPTRWERRDAPGRDLYVISSDPWLSVEVGPLVETTELPGDLIARGLTAGQHLAGLRALPHRTDAGWPLHLQEALVCDPAGAVVQVRLVATYSFVIYATAILVRAATEEVLASGRAEIIGVLEQARPLLHGQSPAAIAELWSLEGAP